MEFNEKRELSIAFAKWLIQKHRSKLEFSDNVNAVNFASDIMVELCHNTGELGRPNKSEEAFEQFLNQYKGL